jgi:putative transposase
MPRPSRLLSEAGTYHVLARGNNGQKLFDDGSDCQVYLELLLRMKSKYEFDVYHYCLMSNHVHFLMRFGDSIGLSRVMHRVNLTFAKRFCRKNLFSGHVFQGRFKTLPIQDDGYLLECGRYIERNPYKAGLVKDPAEYLWSSFRYYSEGKSDPLITPNPIYSGLGKTQGDRQQRYADYVRLDRPYDDWVEKELHWQWAGKGTPSRTGARTALF